MAAFDFFLNGSERLTALHNNISFNRLLVEDSHEHTRCIELTKEKIQYVILWNGTRMNLKDFIDFVRKELSLIRNKEI